MVNKYKNKKVIVDNHKFDSKREASRYEQLKILENAGYIFNLELQKKFVLQPSYKINGRTVKEIKYVADFVYNVKDNDKLVVEDTKGFRTKEYLLKKKIFEYLYGIEINEI